MKKLFLLFLFFSTTALAVCRVPGSVNPRKVHRGMYVSLQTKNIGQMPLSYLLDNILGSASRENALLSFINKYQFDSLSLYDLQAIMADPVSQDKLSRFIQAAKACGVVEVNAIGAVNRNWPTIKAYQASRTGKFNGLVTEIEFWNGGSFPDFISQLQYMRTVMPLSITPYIGWLNNLPGLNEMQAALQIAQNTDRVFVHAYVKNPSTAYGYTQSRVNALLASKSSLPIWPIFSAEGMTYSAGSEKFMGDWLSIHSLDEAEAIYSISYTPKGFQYFEYSFLKLYLK